MDSAGVTGGVTRRGGEVTGLDLGVGFGVLTLLGLRETWKKVNEKISIIINVLNNFKYVRWSWS